MINTDSLCMGCMNDNGGEKVCPVCGCESTRRNGDDFLPAKLVLSNRYTVGLAKKRNGESVSYIGWDNSADTAVTVKEYFPSGFALRNPDKTVGMVSGGEYTFNEGLLEFLEINRTIKESALPSLMPVTDVFEENGTVYAVSANISSITLKEFLAKNGGSLKWEQARPLFLPLIDTVKGMNDLGIIHGGISVDTVLVGRDGKLRISDYGIKKLRLAESELKSELYSGFAAIEQYDPNLHTDTYTDVYGLCAVLFTVLIGNTPAEAPLRLQNDSMTIPARFAEELPRHVLSALANGLQVKPENRTKDIEDLKNELVYAETAETAAPAVKKTVKNDIQSSKPKKSGGTAKYVAISSACTAVVFLLIIAILAGTVFRESIFGKDDKDKTNTSSVSAPSVDQIGSVDAGAEETAKLYAVPDLLGKYYAEIIDNEDYEKFVFTIKDEEYNDKYSRGKICSQSIAKGTEVVKETKIEVVISLGPKEIKIANVVRLDENAAKLELLKQGFLYDNIEVLEKYDAESAPGTVLEQEPKYGTKVNTNTPVRIYINSYTGEEDPYYSDNR